MNINAYTALWSLALNLVIAVGVTLLLRGAGKVDDTDETSPADYDELVEMGRPAPALAAPTG